MTKRKDTSRRLRQQKYERERATILNFRKQAPRIKQFLRENGCSLPFYDVLDSYEGEFARTVADAMQHFPTLTGIHEVDSPHSAIDWHHYGLTSARQVLFMVEEFHDYQESYSGRTNVRGSTTFFEEPDRTIRSVILISRNPKCSCEHREFKYGVKLVALLHEIGHLRDAQDRTNIDPIARRFDVIEAEVYANLYALERLSERHVRNSYNMLYESLLIASNSGFGYQREMAKLVIERHPFRSIPDWTSLAESILKTG